MGRDPTTLGRSASIVINLPMAQDRSGQPGTISHEEITRMLRGYAREGLGHVQLWLTPNTIASVEWFAGVLDLLDRSEA